MTKETFNRKKKALFEQYTYWANIRNSAIEELNKIVNKIHELEDEYDRGR